MRALTYFFRRWSFFLRAGFVSLAALVLGANFWVIARSRERVVSDVNRLPAADVGLVLGTSPMLRGHVKNPFFEGRMNAAAFLYKTGKVRHLLLSGDNGTRDYDEPKAMRAALLARGVPESATTLDDAGFRTLDSMVRARTVFKLDRITIITDGFHQSRAVFLAQAQGLNAHGFPSEDVPFAQAEKTLLREIASRFVACLDVYVFSTKPRRLGRSEPIVIAQGS